MFCYCGNEYGKHGMAEGCVVACLGDDNLLCGGFSSNYVYHVDGECDYTLTTTTHQGKAGIKIMLFGQ